MNHTGDLKDQSGSMEFTFKLEDFESGSSYDALQGNEFANTVTYISRGDYVPEKKKYPAFRKIFYEEGKFNPALTSSNDKAFTAHEKEQTTYWKSKGKKFDTQERFVEDKGHNGRGPVKAEEYPHLFEKGEKYYGRERKILPYLRAQIYSRPLHRVDDSERKKILAPSTIGPQTYDLGDYWQPKTYRTVGPSQRPSPFMASKTKRDIIKDLGVPEETGSPHKKPLMRPLLSSSEPTLTSSPSTDANFGNNPPSPTSRPNTGGFLRPHTPGGVLPRAVDDPFNLGGRTDYHFVRVKQPDGKVHILPVTNDDGSPIAKGLESPTVIPSPIREVSSKVQHPPSAASPQFSVIETWGRPVSRAEAERDSHLQVESVSLQKWPFNGGSSTLELSEIRQEEEMNRPKTGESRASSKKGASRAASRNKANISRSVPTSMSTMSPSGEGVVQRAASPKPVSARRPTPNDTRPTQKYFASPCPSVRSLSYKSMVSERKFNSHVNPNPKSPPKVNLCMSEKVALQPSASFVNLESRTLPHEESEEYAAKASERSLEILGSFSHWEE